MDRRRDRKTDRDKWMSRMKEREIIPPKWLRAVVYYSKGEFSPKRMEENKLNVVFSSHFKG
jgi:hypothetical protein